eukprot:5954178-Amphidinium_carterae.1
MRLDGYLRHVYVFWWKVFSSCRASRRPIVEFAIEDKRKLQMQKERDDKATRDTNLSTFKSTGAFSEARPQARRPGAALLDVMHHVFSLNVRKTRRKYT